MTLIEDCDLLDNLINIILLKEGVNNIYYCTCTLLFLGNNIFIDICKIFQEFCSY